MKAKQYKLRTEVWIYPGDVAWHFVTIDKKESKEIKEGYKGIRRGFGSIPVEVKIGNTVWETSIFPVKDGTYLLPIKAIVRRKESIFDGDNIKIAFTIR